MDVLPGEVDMKMFLLQGMLAGGAAAADEPTVPTTVREYRLLAGPDITSMDAIANAGVTLNKAFTDLYIQGIRPVVPDPIETPVRVVWSIFWTFNCSIWPHDAGHWARARQNGGDFVIDRYRFPFPEARMVQPPEGSVTPEQATLSSVGGHEINHLMARRTQEEFYLRGYAHPDQLIHSFISQVYFPFYVFVVANVRTKPKEASTWTDTWGDPVESTLSIYESYYDGRNALLEDGSVDPDLVHLYWETVIASAGAVVLDPMTYQAARGFGHDLDYGVIEPWMLGSDRFGWMYGVRFNHGPLGYEIYLTNYLRIMDELAIVSLKAGRPYRNLGLTVQAPELAVHDHLILGLRGEIWNQDVYGTSAAAYATAIVPIHGGFGLVLHGGYKGDGYVVGQRLEAGPLVLGGLNYAFEVH